MGGDYRLDVNGTDNGAYALQIVDLDVSPQDALTLFDRTLSGKVDSFLISASQADELIVLRSGDIDGNGAIDVHDLDILLSELVKSVSESACGRRCDLNNDDWIDNADVAQLKAICGIACNRPPVANAGVRQTVEASSVAGASVTLNGTASSDPDGDPLSFAWAGPFGTVPGPTPTVVLPLGTNLLTLTVNDGRGGVGTASVTATIVDTTSPTISITSPAVVTYRLRQLVLANFSCVDVASGVASCTGAVPSGGQIDTATVGTKSFAVSAADKAGNTSVRSVNYSAGYGVCPLFDQTKAHKRGSTVPIKLQLCDFNAANASGSSIVVHASGLTQRDSTATSVVEDSGNANPDDNFRYDPTLGGTGGYIFNLSTTGLSTGTWVLNFTASGDPTQHSVQFDVK
jgi:hypothetical protein